MVLVCINSCIIHLLLVLINLMYAHVTSSRLKNVYIMYVCQIRQCVIEYTALALVASAVAIEEVNFVYSSDHLMRFSTADHDEQFNDPFSVRNQIQCLYECVTRSIELAYYYALYKPEHLQCVCKRDFD